MAICTTCLAAPLRIEHQALVRASFYANKFEGKKTASGMIFSQKRMTAASLSFPLGTAIQVYCPATDRTVNVIVNDRGPASRRFGLDLSMSAFRSLGLDPSVGWAWVRIEKVTQPMSAYLNTRQIFEGGLTMPEVTESTETVTNEIAPKDRIGQEITVGSYVAYGHALGRSAGIQIGKVLKITSEYHSEIRGRRYDHSLGAYVDSVMLRAPYTSYKLTVWGVNEDHEGFYGRRLCRSKGVLGYPSRMIVVPLDKVPAEIVNLLQSVDTNSTAKTLGLK